MSEFEGQIWVAQNNDEVNFVCTTKRVKNKIQVINEKGREQRLSADKLLWQYPSTATGTEDWQVKLTKIQTTVNSLSNDIDVALLWETALELEISTVNELADLYFGEEITLEHLVATWRAVAEDRLHFKHHQQNWEPRSVEQFEELKTQREREESRLKAQILAKDWLQKIAKISLPIFPNLSVDFNPDTFQITEVPEEIVPFIERLEAWLRGDSDRDVEELLTRIGATLKLSPRELAFEILQKTGRLSLDADRDVILGGFKSEFSATVDEIAQAIQPWQPSTTQTITELFFSIDDEETREVDDALAIERDGSLWKITVAIADPASVIHRGDTIDREALRRGTTVYLPTQTIFMLPPSISCNIASLTAGEVRSSLVTRAWLDEQGEITKSTITREPIRVLKRLHYSEADRLIIREQDTSGQHLRDLLTCAKLLQAKRYSEGAFTLQRPEYKISIKDDTIAVTMIEKDSPTRMLVAEMMILANRIAARYAQRNKIPIIYRVQEPPLEPITKEMTSNPFNFHKVRKLLGRSSLSMQPGSHSGLGLPMYTQLTSPLRRFADLVMQRQLMAHLVAEELPYDEEELLKVLETADRSAREARSVENEAKKRLLIQYLKDNWGNERPLEVAAINEVKGGYKVEILPWGIEAYLATPKALEIGQKVMTIADKIRVKAGSIRLKISK